VSAARAAGAGAGAGAGDAAAVRAAADAGAGDAAAVRAAADLAEALLWPNALRTEATGLLPAELRPALARAGLFGLVAPGGVTPVAFRAVQEHLAGGCLASAFVWNQHHSPLRLVAASANRLLRDRWLAPLTNGEALAAVAFSQLRRPDGGVRAAPLSSGERRRGDGAGGDRGRGGGRGGGGGRGDGAGGRSQGEGGYVLTGVAPWVTSWTLADVLVVGALAPPTPAAPTGLVVWGAIGLSAIEEPEPADGSHPVPTATRQRPGSQLPGPQLPGLVATPVPLAVLGATRTVALRFEGFRLPEKDVVCEEPREDFDLRDRLATASPNPLALGVAARAVRLLAERQPALAAVLAAAVDDCRNAGTGLLAATAALPAGSTPDTAQLGALRSNRVRGLLLASQATTALVAASGGRAISATDPAQLLHRHAAFLLVQAQTPATREATLAALVAGIAGRDG